MNVTQIRELYEFNAWAHRRVFDALVPLPAAQYLEDLKSSHGGIHGTLCHVVWAEQLWLTRWLGQPAPAGAQGKDLGSLAEGRGRWGAVQLERGRSLQRLTDATRAATLRVVPSMGRTCGHSYGPRRQRVGG